MAGRVSECACEWLFVGCSQSTPPADPCVCVLPCVELRAYLMEISEVKLWTRPMMCLLYLQLAGVAVGEGATPCTDGRPPENTPPWLGLHQSSLVCVSEYS